MNQPYDRCAADDVPERLADASTRRRPGRRPSVRVGERREDAVELPARRRHRPERGDRRSERPSPRSPLAASRPPDRDRADRRVSSRSWIAIEAVADVDIVGVGRAPAPAALERVVRDGEEVGDDAPDSGARAAEERAGWSGIGRDGREVGQRVVHRPSVAPVG